MGRGLGFYARFFGFLGSGRNYSFKERGREAAHPEGRQAAHPQNPKTQKTARKRPGPLTISPESLGFLGFGFGAVLWWPAAWGLASGAWAEGGPCLSLYNTANSLNINNSISINDSINGVISSSKYE